MSIRRLYIIFNNKQKIKDSFGSDIKLNMSFKSKQLYNNNYKQLLSKGLSGIYKPDTLIDLIQNKEYSISIFAVPQISENTYKEILKNYWLIIVNIDKYKQTELFNSMLLINKVLRTLIYNTVSSTRIEMIKNYKNIKNQVSVKKKKPTTEQHSFDKKINYRFIFERLIFLNSFTSQQWLSNYKYWKRKKRKKRKLQLYKRLFFIQKYLNSIIIRLATNRWSHYKWMNSYFISSTLRTNFFLSKELKASNINSFIYLVETEGSYVKLENIYGSYAIQDLWRKNSIVYKLKNYSNYICLPSKYNNIEKSTEYLLSKKKDIKSEISELIHISKDIIFKSLEDQYKYYKYKVLGKRLVTMFNHINYFLTKELACLLIFEKYKILSIRKNLNSEFCKCFDTIRSKWNMTAFPQSSTGPRSKIPEVNLSNTELEHPSIYSEGYIKYVFRRLNQLKIKKRSDRFLKKKKKHLLDIQTIMNIPTHTLEKEKPIEELDYLFKSTMNPFVDDYRWYLYFIFQDYHIKTFVNFLMKKGKKNNAYKIFFETLQLLKDVCIMSPLLMIKMLFSSNHQYFIQKTVIQKKKKRINYLLFNFKNRINTFYHKFFNELKELYVTDFLSISEKLSYLLVSYAEHSQHDTIDESMRTDGSQLYETRFMLQENNSYTKKKTMYKYNDHIKMKDQLLNYKKKF